MSCNGCRVLRKGCSDSCVLRPCLQWIESSEAQGYATVFVAKFFGRAGLMGFISAVQENQRPALFQSLLYEACGRTVNPVFGAVGLLSNGNWQICQAAVDTVLKGGQLRPKSPSSCLPANLSSSAPCSPAFATSGNFPIPLVGRVDDPTQMTPPLSSNVSADNFLDRHAMNLGIELPAAKGGEREECATNGRRNNDYSNGCRREAAPGQGVEPCPIWQNDNMQRDSWNHSHMNAGTNGHWLGHEFLLDQRDAQLNGPAYVAPRRVRARLESNSVPPSDFGERVQEIPVPAHGGEQLELDLTLQVKGVKGDRMAGTKRLSSPCDSLNSEGSVTSVDTMPREPSKLSSWALETNHSPAPFCKLLPLLQ